MSRLSGIGAWIALVALIAAAALAAATPSAAAPVTVARLQYAGGDWYGDPSSLPNWLREFAARTGVETAPEPATVTMDSEDLYRYPLLYLVGHGGIDLDDREVRELRRFLDTGGFLFANDNYGLDPAFRALMARVFPDSPLRLLGSEHPIYHCFYDLPGLPKIHEHDGAPAQAFGVERDGRLVVFYAWSSDIGDGLEDPQVHGDPPEAREAAVRMAVNILTYALTRP